MKGASSLQNLVYKSKGFFKRQGPTILTTVGAVGVVATSVMTAKATIKATKLVEEATDVKGEKLITKEIIKVAGPSYIPAAMTGVATITCIFGANVLNKRQQAALASAYAFLDQSYKEYKEKIEDLYGEEVVEEVKKELAKDDYKEADIPEEEDDGKRLFYEAYSGRYFRATNETVLRAEYEINKMLNEGGGASLNDYYDLLNIPRTDYGDFIGWSAAQMYEMYWDSWLYFHHTNDEMEDGLEYCIIDMTEPFADYDEY